MTTQFVRYVPTIDSLINALKQNYVTNYKEDTIIYTTTQICHTISYNDIIH